jgi:hypothetical protein
MIFRFTWLHIDGGFGSMGHLLIFYNYAYFVGSIFCSNAGIFLAWIVNEAQLVTSSCAKV